VCERKRRKREKKEKKGLLLGFLIETGDELCVVSALTIWYSAFLLSQGLQNYIYTKTKQNKEKTYFI
jgi:hypothetical protein